MKEFGVPVQAAFHGPFSEPAFIIVAFAPRASGS